MPQRNTVSSVPEAASFTMAEVQTPTVSQITAASDILTENTEPDTQVTKYLLTHSINPVYKHHCKCDYNVSGNLANMP